MKRIAAQLTVFTVTAMSLVAFVMHWPCRNSGYVGDRFTSMCYSDIAAFVANPPLSSGNSPFGVIDMSPLPAALLWMITKLSSNFIVSIVIAQLFIVTALFVLAYATSLHRAWRPLDAAVVAATPLWPLVMFVSVDVIGVAFAALALAYWERYRFTAAGVLAGLAMLSGGWAWVLLLAMVIDGARASLTRQAMRVVAIAFSIAVVGNIPAFINTGKVMWWNSTIGDGSILLVWRAVFGTAPNINNMIAIIGVIAIVFAARWAYHLPFEFRIETLVLLLVIIQLVSSPSIAPQSLTRIAWLLPLVFARRTHIITYSGILISYVMLVWLHLEGKLDGGKGAPDQAFALMSFIALLTLCFMAYQVVMLMRVQGLDPVKRAMATYMNETQRVAQ